MMVGMISFQAVRFFTNWDSKMLAVINTIEVARVRFLLASDCCAAQWHNNQQGAVTRTIKPPV
jgi:hypothetical protein